MEDEEAIKYYFNQGFEFKEILLFLKTYHNLEISMRTLLRRLQVYGVKRRCCETEGELRTKHFRVKNRIKEMLDGPGPVGDIVPFGTHWKWRVCESLALSYNPC